MIDYTTIWHNVKISTIWLITYIARRLPVELVTPTNDIIIYCKM